MLDQRAMHARLLLEKVADAALGLPEEQRGVLFLVCVEGLTYRDAAEVLGIPIGTVMSRLARARLGLMREIEHARHGDVRECRPHGGTMNELDDATLVAFVDGELEPTAMREVAALVARDPAAEEKVRRLRASATLVRAAFSDPRYQVVPAALSERLARAELGRPSRRRTFGLAAAASIAALLLGISGGAALRDAGAPPSHPDNPLLADIAEYHAVYAREGDDFGAVPATQAADIEAYCRKTAAPAGAHPRPLAVRIDLPGGAAAGRR